MTALETKASWRRRLREERAARTTDDRAAAGVAAVQVLTEQWAELGAPDVVAAFVSVGTEPDTAPLLRSVFDAGARLLLPVLLDDDDLAWASVQDPRGLTTLKPGRRGIPEPPGPRSPLDAGLIVCPALAVDGSGTRLGQGGGSYDRALARVAADVLTLAYVFDSEILAAGTLPCDAHDRPVDGALTPTRLVRF